MSRIAPICRCSESETGRVFNCVGQGVVALDEDPHKTCVMIVLAGRASLTGTIFRLPGRHETELWVGDENATCLESDALVADGDPLSNEAVQ